MAKSLFKPGVVMTRAEKKKLREILPHPNRGRKLYQWKVENRILEKKLMPHLIKLEEQEDIKMGLRAMVQEPSKDGVVTEIDRIISFDVITDVPEVKPGIKLYIDDIRDPTKYLTAEQAEGIVWVKTWWDARNFLRDNEAELEVIHFDHYMDEPQHTGGDLFQMMAYRLSSGEEYRRVKQIYLHSSDSTIVEKLMEWKDRLAEHGVELISNSQR